MDNKNLVHIKTKTGLEIDIDPASADDMELLDACYEVQEAGNMLALPKAAPWGSLPYDLRAIAFYRTGRIPEALDAARKALYDHVRVDGRVPYAALMAEVVDIMGAVGQINAANVQATPAPAPAPVPVTTTPAPVPPMASAADDKERPAGDDEHKTPPPPELIDGVMERMRAVMTNTDPQRLDELESAARATLKVTNPDGAWHLLNKISSEVQLLELANMTERIVDAEAVKAAQAHQSAQASADAATMANISAE